MEYTINEQLIRVVINTLKSLDVRGYESYNAVVELVNLFEKVLMLSSAQAPKGEENNAITDNTES